MAYARPIKSKVYFIPVSGSDSNSVVTGKLKHLLKESAILDIIRKSYRVAVKIHFGEEGNTGFVRPECARIVRDSITAKGATAYLVDTNTLYRGRRANSKDHLKMAHEHGFTKEATGAAIIIPDETRKEDAIDVKAAGKMVRTAKLARFFVECDAIVAMSHFKGHMLTGFGGAIKNIGMGCATREGKLAQHCDVSPVVYTDKCVGCGACAKICPSVAIRILVRKSVIDRSKCIGCANCIAVCPTSAMFIDMTSGDAVQIKMAEYAAAALKRKKERSGFLNFAVRINKECDCWGEETPRIAPDVGIFASSDPVSIDRSSLDLVKRACGRDVFKEAHPDQDGDVQLATAARLGLGSLDYELIEL